jgi:hypothetical protein
MPRPVGSRNGAFGKPNLAIGRLRKTPTPVVLATCAAIASVGVWSVARFGRNDIERSADNASLGLAFYQQGDYATAAKYFYNSTTDLVHCNSHDCSFLGGKALNIQRYLTATYAHLKAKQPDKAKNRAGYIFFLGANGRWTKDTVELAKLGVVALWLKGDDKALRKSWAHYLQSGGSFADYKEWLSAQVADVLPAEGIEKSKFAPLITKIEQLPIPYRRGQSWVDYQRTE